MGGGYRANVTRGHALALVVVAGAAIQAAGAGAGIGGVPAGAVSGRWVGGFQLGSVPTGLHVTLSQRHGHLRGTAEIGLAAPPVEEPLRRVSVHRARVTLILPDGTLLEGRRRGSLIAGIARAGNSRGRFELRSIRPVALRELRHAVGAYRLANGSVISLFVEPFGSHLRIVDYQSGEMRQLWPVSRDAFLGGPRLLVPWPIRFRVELVRDARGKVVGLRRNGQNADRIPLVIESAAFPQWRCSARRQAGSPPGARALSGRRPRTRLGARHEGHARSVGDVLRLARIRRALARQARRGPIDGSLCGAPERGEPAQPRPRCARRNALAADPGGH